MMTEPLPESDNEISLLDIAAAIARFWVLLIVGPLIVGLIVFGYLRFFQSDSYESSAILQISPSEAALLESAQVIDPALQETGWLARYDGSVTRARRGLSNALTVEKMGDVDYYRASLVGERPEEVNRTLKILISELVANSEPRGSRKLSLENELQSLEQSRQDLNASFQRLSTLYESMEGSPSSTILLMSDLGQSFVTLINNIARTEQEIFSTRLALEGTVTESDIIQQPTLADAPVQSRAPMIAVLSVLASGFVLLVIVLIYSGLRNAARDPDSAEKLQQIRQAFQLRRQPAL